jgi:L-fuculose-phosphate aldolase
MKTKAHFMERVSREMDEDLPFLEGSTAELLAACCRILARENHESGLAGQVTARAAKPGTFWTLQFGYGFE